MIIVELERKLNSLYAIMNSFTVHDAQSVQINIDLMNAAKTGILQVAR